MIAAKRNSQKWIFWLLLMVNAIYLALTLNWEVNNQQQHHRLQNTLSALPLLLPAQQLTQQLQVERAMLAGFATQQLPVRPPIEQQQMQTDVAWRNLELFINDHPNLAQSEADYLSALPEPQVLFSLRQNIAAHKLSSTEVKRAYSALLRPLLDLAEHIQQQNELAGLAKPLSAIVALTEAIERAGQERALLHVAFATHQMSASRYQSYVILVGEQKDYLQRFSQLVSPDLQQQWLKVQSQFEEGTFVQLREQALARQFTGDVTLWFALANARIDQIYQLRFEMCMQLLQQAKFMDQQLKNTFQQLLLQLQWLLIIFLLCAWRLYRLHSHR